MTERRSIARALLIRLAGLFLLAPLLASIEILIVGEQGPNQQTIARLEQEADAIGKLLHLKGGQVVLDRKALTGSMLHASRFALYGSGSSSPILHWPDDLELRTWDEFGGYDTVRSIDGRPIRFFFAPPANSWKAWFDWYSDELTDEMLPIVAILMGIIVPLSLVTIRRGLAPVRQLAEQAARIDPGEENARLSEGDAPQELLPLVRAVNAGLERLGAGLAAQRRFSAIAAHELRTPLAILLMQLDRIAKNGGIEEAKQQVHKMRRLIDQLLVISELSAKRLRIDADVDVAVVVRDAIAQETSRALDAGVSISLDEPATPLVLKGNAAAIGAAVRNLIDNAVKHSNGSGCVVVRILPAQQAIEVSDEGPGVPTADRSQIFEPFWRRKDSKGAGVGLAIVREMAELHGGHVSLRDNVPHGSIFRIAFANHTTNKTAFCSG